MDKNNATTLTIPVTEGFDGIHETNDSDEGTLFQATFTAQTDVTQGWFKIHVEETNKARLLRRCHAVIAAGSIRATGWLNFDRVPSKPELGCHHSFVAVSFRPVKQKLD